MVTKLIQARWPQLQAFVPGLFDACGEMLYVGANKNRHHYMPEFYANGHTITLLEVWEPYIRGVEHKEMIHRAILGDVRDVATLDLGQRMFDYTFFWHGPEHLEPDELEETVFQLERITRYTVILGSPWGKYPQGAVNGNPFETHASMRYPADYHRYGYEVETLGQQDTIDSNILAWKCLRPQTRRRSAKKDLWLANLNRS